MRQPAPDRRLRELVGRGRWAGQAAPPGHGCRSVIPHRSMIAQILRTVRAENDQGVSNPCTSTGPSPRISRRSTQRDIKKPPETISLWRRYSLQSDDATDVEVDAPFSSLFVVYQLLIFNLRLIIAAFFPPAARPKHAGLGNIGDERRLAPYDPDPSPSDRSGQKAERSTARCGQAPRHVLQ